MHSMLQGMLLGLTIALLIGPALFSLLQTSIHTGKKAGFFLALGITLSDTLIVYLAYIGVLQLLDTKNNVLIIGVIGGVILISFGLYTYLKKMQIDNNKNIIRSPMSNPFTYIGKGFFLNLFNPFVWFFWITAMVTVSTNFDERKEIIYFFFGTLLTVFSSDIIKVIISDIIKEKIKHNFLIKINKIIGVILIVFGIVLIVRTFVKF